MSSSPESDSKRTRIAFLFVIVFALIKLGMHLWVNAYAGYGYFRDELYYLACADHLGWGYVDHPPLSIWILEISRTLIGDSLFSLRLAPAVAGALTVVCTGLLILDLGGGSRAVAIGSIAVIAAPIHMAMSGFYSMNALDLMLWSLAALLLHKAVQTKRWRYWLTLGLVLGFGLLNKVSFLWLGVGILIGLIVSSHRKQLLTAKPYAAAGLALLVFSPYILWNLNNDFAHLEFMQNALEFKYSGINRTDFLVGQLLLANPYGILLWLIGLYAFFIWKTGRKHLILGLMFLVVFLILIFNGSSKAEYLAAAYPLLFVGGALLVEHLSQSAGRRWVAAVFVTLQFATAAFVAPMALPVLPAEQFIQYQQLLGLAPSNSEGKEEAELPQFFADMHGWEELARTISEVYTALPESEQAGTIVFVQNYGEAGALDFYRDQYTLPRVVSTHNSYWLWGYGKEPFEQVIVLGGSQDDHLRSCLSAEAAGTFTAPYIMPYEDQQKIWICRELIRDFAAIWQEERNYN